MTVGETVRELQGIVYRIELSRKEHAQFDYALSQLIISGVGKCLGGKQSFPKLYDAYPQIFKEELEKQQELERTELSVARFMAFAQRHNRKVT